LWSGYALLIHVLVHLGQGTPNLLDFAFAAGGALLAVLLIGYLQRSPSGRLDKPFATR
jgi:hypothetical protein